MYQRHSEAGQPQGFATLANERMARRRRSTARRCRVSPVAVKAPTGPLKHSLAAPLKIVRQDPAGVISDGRDGGL